MYFRRRRRRSSSSRQPIATLSKFIILVSGHAGGHFFKSMPTMSLIIRKDDATGESRISSVHGS